MTIAGKVNALVVLISATAIGLLTCVLIYREYASLLDEHFERAHHEVARHPYLQVALTLRDEKEQQKIASSVLASSPAIRYAFILDPVGTPLQKLQRDQASEVTPRSFYDIRGTRTVAERGLSSYHSDVAPQEHPLLGNVTGGELIWDVTVPILSLINPLQKNITRADYGDALTRSNEVSSLYVIGYVQLGISRTMIVAELVPLATRAGLGALLFIIVCGVFSRYQTRKITAPFSTLVRMADDIGAGRSVEPQGLESSGEFREIVALLNTIIGGLHTYKTKMDVDHQLLSMKVEERTAQLSKRNLELNQAVKEVTETKDRLRQLAYYDSLTTLPNRRLFTEQLDLLLRMARRNKEKVALLFLDLDNFKRINDSLGHSAGDLLLREVAKRLSRCIRDSDLVAHYMDPKSEIDVSRLGGDEFTVVLNQLESPESAAIVARRLLDSLSLPITIQGHEMVVTPSIGIAIAPDDADDVDNLLKAADTAMYSAKSAGKNGYVYYNNAMDATSVEKLTLENDLRKAIERNELVLFYQPQVDTVSGAVIGAEALMRWQHPEQGLVPPFKFIPLAEELGLIGALGEWALRESCRHMVELQSLGLELPKMSVNVSALQFDTTFIDLVREVLNETGLRPMRLQLELTEGIMMDGTEATIRAFMALKEIGVKLSIDDFGTGYSSLSYLSRFPLDELKIDRSFVVDFDKSDNDASLVTTIIAMARSMKLNLVAEGVETHSQFQFLRQHGANVIQGYLFSKPVPLEELKPLLVPNFFIKQIHELRGG